MAQPAVPKFLIVATLGISGQAPAIALKVASSTQIPLFAYKSSIRSAGEEPIYSVKMKDGTVVPIKESLLTQSGGIVMI